MPRHVHRRQILVHSKRAVRLDRIQVVEFRPCLASNLDYVFESGSGDQRHACAATLQERIRAYGRPMHDFEMRRKSLPVSAITCQVPRVIAREGSSGVEASLKMRNSPPASNTKSVNVPPVSTPTAHPFHEFLLRAH